MKKYILGLLTGLIISGSVVFAANYLYHADEVSYTPGNNEWNVTDVKGAIDDLYDKASNSGAIYLGEFSTNTTIDVSSLGATSVDQFIVASQNNRSVKSDLVCDYATVSSTYTPASLSLSGTSLTINVGTESSSVSGGNVYAGGYPNAGSRSKTTTIPVKVYYVGNIINNN